MGAIFPQPGQEFGLSSPAPRAAAITPSDTDNLAQYARALYVGVGGDVKVTTLGGDTVTFTAVSGGGVLPICVRKVFSTGTTATNILALW